MIDLPASSINRILTLLDQDEEEYEQQVQLLEQNHIELMERLPRVSRSEVSRDLAMKEQICIICLEEIMHVKNIQKDIEDSVSGEGEKSAPLKDGRS